MANPDVQAILGCMKTMSKSAEHVERALRLAVKSAEDNLGYSKAALFSAKALTKQLSEDFSDISY